MEKIVFLCVFLYRIVQITSNDVSEHKVTLLRRQLNENITLNCNFNGKYEMAWYHQNLDSGRPMLLIYAYIYGIQTTWLHEGNHSRRRFNVDKVSNTASLVITGLMESDSGLYFCGTKSNPVLEMHFENPIRLQIEVSDKLTVSEDEAHSDVKITDWLTVMERVLAFGGVGLAVLVCFLSIVVAGRNIYYRSWQKGWTAAEHAGLTDQKNPK